MKKSLEKLANIERRRIQEKLAELEPGTEEYAKLLKARNELEDAETKRREGRIRAIDWAKIVFGVLSTAGLAVADWAIPNLGAKLKLSDFVRKLF